jgi:hypothetical protein
MSRRVSVLLVAIRYLSTLLLATGCSWIAMTSPPRVGGQPATTECEERAAPPIIDGAAALAFGGFGAGVIVGTSQADYHTAVIALVSVPSLLIGTLYLASALHGVHVNRDCRAALREQREHAAVAPPRLVCTAGVADAIGACSESEAGCLAARTELLAARHAMSVCERRESAHCFEHATNQGKVVCAPTREMCEGLRREAAARPGSSAIEPCAETR